MNNSSRKNEILQQILQCKDNLQKYRDRNRRAKKHYHNVKEIHDIKESELAEIKRLYEQIALQYQEAASEFSYIRTELKDITKYGKNEKESISRLERELSRLIDSDRIYREFAEKVQALIENSQNQYIHKSKGYHAKPHQLEGAAMMAVAGSGLLADKTGLGKSLTSLIYLDNIKARKIIAIVPNDTQRNFIKEIKAWTDRPIVRIGGLDRDKRDFILDALQDSNDFVIVLNYEAWRRDSHLIEDLNKLQVDTLICDEAHHAKEYHKLTAKGVSKVRFGLNVCPDCDDPKVELDSYTDEWCNKATCMNCGKQEYITEFSSVKHYLPMTATFIKNRPQEMFIHLHGVDSKLFRTPKDFLDSFCEQDPETRHWRWREAGEKQIAQMLGPRFLQRDEKSAGVEIPPQEEIQHLIEWQEVEENYPKQAEAYRHMKRIAQIILDPKRRLSLSAPVTIAQYTRLRQIITWPAGIKVNLKDDDDNIIETIHFDVRESAKIDKAEEIIKEALGENDRVILFSQFATTLEELHRRFGERACRYDGSTSKFVKDQIEKDFDINTATKYPAWDIVLANYKSMGEGLNFQTARQMILLDSEWNPGGKNQAMGRNRRMGQTQETIVHVIDVENTVDTWMANLIEEKKGIIGGFEYEAGNISKKFYEALVNNEI